MYAEQLIVDNEGQIRIALVWLQDEHSIDKQEVPYESVVTVDFDDNRLENIVNFDLN